MNTNENYKSTLLNEPVPEEIGRYLDYSMTITRRIIEKLRSESITLKKFAKALGKKESQVSEWLIGRHNFSLRLLSEISVKHDLDFSDAFRLPGVNQQNFSPVEGIQDLNQKLD